MIADDEYSPASPSKRPINHEIGESLDRLSLAEIKERIELLQAEIVRLEQGLLSKQESQAAAAAFFKT